MMSGHCGEWKMGDLRKGDDVRFGNGIAQAAETRAKDEANRGLMLRLLANGSNSLVYLSRCDEHYAPFWLASSS